MNREEAIARTAAALEASFADRAAVLLRQVRLLLSQMEPVKDRMTHCRLCGRGQRRVHVFRAHGKAIPEARDRYPISIAMCVECTALCAENLRDAEAGRDVPEPGMVIADVTRALERFAPDSATTITDVLRRRATPEKRRRFLPACGACATTFERCSWRAALPGIDLCDDCIAEAAKALLREGCHE